MIDFSDEFRKITEGRFVNMLGLDYPGMKVQFDGVPFDQPRSDAWAAISIMENPARKMTIGRRFVVRTTGFLQIDIIQVKEKSQGLVGLKKTAQKAADYFTYEKLQNSLVNAKYEFKHVTDISSKSHHRISARVFFHYDGFSDKPLV